MSTHADPPPHAISYEEYLRRRIADPLTICGPPVIGQPSGWSVIFPWLKPEHIRQLEHQAREAELEPGAGA
jgi:hypothetical protein